jgi:flavin reductase (DIM6/NTAB) family NADH-FMN oxidoreductase RutF
MPEMRENEGVRMQKNRDSARNSRQRKKIYISLLERKVEDLNSQIEGLRQ